MSSAAELLDCVVSETLKCQDPASPESVARVKGQYAPLGPHLTDLRRGSYPTTDAAMSALAEIADNLSVNDPDLARSHSRDAVRAQAAHVVARMLQELALESDVRIRWKKFRDALKVSLAGMTATITHYIPAWLFVGQQCAAFEIGPVRFVQRQEWLTTIEQLRGRESSWMAAVRETWAGERTQTDGQAKSNSEDLAIRAVARSVNADQWLACVRVEGFEKEESRYRGVLASRIAIDTVRLVVPPAQGRRMATVLDQADPRQVERYSQVEGQDMARGSALNMPGISGAPGFARDLVNHSRALFDAAGRCLEVATVAKHGHRCPKLAERWLNACEWFGRACVADADYTSVVMYIISLDVLCGGLEQEGIAQLLARLTGTPLSAPVLPDTTLVGLVNKLYKMRSEIAHGSILAVFRDLDEDRAVVAQLAQASLAEYAIALDAYASNGGEDDRDAFRGSLPAAVP